jgi:hypothetical protein
MRKEELIALIEANVPDGADVRFAIPTHDYWRTYLAIDPTKITEEKVKPTAYHDGQDAIETDNEVIPPDEYDPLKTVYVLS